MRGWMKMRLVGWSVGRPIHELFLPYLPARPPAATTGLMVSFEHIPPSWLGPLTLATYGYEWVGSLSSSWSAWSSLRCSTSSMMSSTCSAARSTSSLFCLGRRNSGIMDRPVEWYTLCALNTTSQAKTICYHTTANTATFDIEDDEDDETPYVKQYSYHYFYYYQPKNARMDRSLSNWIHYHLLTFQSHLLSSPSSYFHHPPHSASAAAALSRSKTRSRRHQQLLLYFEAKGRCGLGLV